MSEKTQYMEDGRIVIPYECEDDPRCPECDGTLTEQSNSWFCWNNGCSERNMHYEVEFEDGKDNRLNEAYALAKDLSEDAARLVVDHGERLFDKGYDVNAVAFGCEYHVGDEDRQYQLEKSCGVSKRALINISNAIQPDNNESY